MKYKLLIINGSVIHIGNILYDNILEARNKAEEIEKLTGMYTEVIADSEAVLDDIDLVHQENKDLKEYIKSQSDLIKLYQEYRSDMLRLIGRGEGIATYHLKSVTYNKIKQLELEMNLEEDKFVKMIKKVLEDFKKLGEILNDE